MHKQLKADVLVWVNEIRAKQDLRPLKALPKGTREDAFSCVLGRATGLVYSNNGVARDYGRVLGVDPEAEVTLPKRVKRFEKLFEKGEMPELERRKPGAVIR